MASKGVPSRLTTAQILEMFAGSKVDIYVGPESEHFHLPKDILCHYSTYFDRCFNGGFKEAKEQKLYLSEDRLEYFQHLLDYMFLNGGNPFKADGDHKTQMKYYMGFIDYAEKYDLIGAVQIIYPALKRLVEDIMMTAKDDWSVPPNYIETVFRVLPEGHELRELVVILVLKFGFFSGAYTLQEKTVEGFAFDILKQLRKDAVFNQLGKVAKHYTGRR